MEPLNEQQLEAFRRAKVRHLDLNKLLKEYFSDDPPSPPKPKNDKPKK